ncbi:hypothetical protein HOLleu_34113 [Holothuria leucospilota]|uniref:Uncharacterized protein n=1 Tax=Holothuria leucospilota TaxID=206669 RepID=A0A9Q0YT70_HOLLE|nr:hypothetical protein HOLleu_34113 [Holothuria leucospilota]
MAQQIKMNENSDTPVQNHEPIMNQGLLRKRHVFQNVIVTAREDGSMHKPIRNLPGQKKGGRSSSMTVTSGLLLERQDEQSFSGTFLQSHIMPGMKTSTKPEGLQSSRGKSSHPASPNRTGTNSTGNMVRKKRIRFLSADHVPCDTKEEMKNFESHDQRKIKSRTKSETKNFQKSERAKIYLGSGPQNGVGRGNNVESPEVWLQKARQRKMAKGSKFIKKQASQENPSKDADGSTEVFEGLDSVTHALSRTNFCDIIKTTRILKWLADVLRPFATICCTDTFITVVTNVIAEIYRTIFLGRN